MSLYSLPKEILIKIIKEMRVFIVITEDYYGGDQKAVFSTLELAIEYRDKMIIETEGKVDFIIQELVFNQPEVRFYHE